MRIVTDTNVIVSAFVFGGLPQRVLALGAKGAYVVCLSEAIQSEVDRVLSRKFAWNRDRINSSLRWLGKWVVILDPEPSLSVVKEDPDDDRILECAVAAQAQVLVSGDRHLLSLGTFQSIAIQTPRQFLETHAWRLKC